NLDIRACVRATTDGGTELLTRNGAIWRSVRSVEFGDSLSIVGFGGDPQQLYVLSSKDANTARLLRIDLNGTADADLAGEDTYDVSRVLTHPRSGEPQAVAVTRDRLEWIVIDPKIQDDFDRLHSPDTGDLNVITRSDDDTRWLLAYTRDNASTSYYLYDRHANDVRK